MSKIDYKFSIRDLFFWIYFKINIEISKSLLETYGTKPTIKTNDATVEARRKRSQSFHDVKRCLSISPTMRPTMKNVLILSTYTDSNKPMMINFDG